MAVLKRKIEDRSITALQTIIDEHPTMEGHINKCDKELSWDGFIRIFLDDDSESDKKNFDDDIPIQIKGHIDKDRKYMDEDRVKTSVSLDDLKVYYRKFGCLYFVMYMNEDGSDVEIFYSSLYPSKIKGYLDEAERKGNKDSFTIPFVKLSKDPKELYLLCKQFSFEIGKQGSGRGQIVPRTIEGKDLKQVKKITATTMGGATPFDLLKRIHTGDLVLYGTIDDSGVQFPLHFDQMVASVKDRVESPISIKDKVYYDSFEMETTVTAPDVKNYLKDGSYVICPSKNLTLRLNFPEIKFSFQFNTDIHQLKRDAEFVLDLLKNKELSVLGGKTTLNNEKLDDGLKEDLQGIVEIGNVLEEVNCQIPIPINELTKEDRKQLNFLHAIKTGQAHFKTDRKVFLYTWIFRDKQWPIIVDITEGDIKLFDYTYSDKIVFTITKPGEKAPVKMPEDANIVPNFLRYEAKLLANLYYYDYESFYAQIDKSVFNEDTADELNNLALHFISAYDLNGDAKMLDIADTILKRLQETVEEPFMFTINRLQIEKRKSNTLSDESEAELERLKNLSIPEPKGKKQPNIRRTLSYCIAVIEGGKDQADLIYKTLSKEDRLGVDSWPIRTLHLKLK